MLNSFASSCLEKGLWYRIYELFCENMDTGILSFCVDSEQGDALNIGNSCRMKILTFFQKFSDGDLAKYSMLVG